MMQHTIHLVLWDIEPSPAIAGAKVSVKVGAKCTCGCSLADQLVSIHDRSGAELTSGRLQSEPLPGTRALFWREMEIPAPARYGTHAWSARLAAQDPLPDHRASAEFSVHTSQNPEHLMTVLVMKRGSLTPLPNAEVRFGPVRAISDESGIASFMAPLGTFNLSAWKVGYDSPVQSVEVKAGGSLTLLVSEREEEDSDDQYC